MSDKIRAYAIMKSGGPFERYDYDPGELAALCSAAD